MYFLYHLILKQCLVEKYKHKNSFFLQLVLHNLFNKTFSFSGTQCTYTLVDLQIMGLNAQNALFPTYIKDYLHYKY